MNEESTQSPKSQDRLQQILLDYVEAAERGAAPERQGFIAAHPEFAEEIVDFLGSYHEFNRLAAPMRVNEDNVPKRREDATAVALSPSLPNSVNSPQTTGELGQLGDFRLLREIGRGGMGVVYEADQISLRRRVALKILPFAGGVDARQLQRFRNEAEAAAHLHHSHIVPVFAVGAERGVHFYAMQYIEGQSLSSLIVDLCNGADGKANGLGMPANVAKESQAARSTQAAMVLSTAHSTRSNHYFQRVATIARQTAEALEYAHQMGVIHRDIKPANLLLDGRGEVWITDFGLAQFQNQAGLTMTGELVGTLRYVSPEQAMAQKGLVDHRTDIYSLGATLYELLTLEPVFDGRDRHALLHQIGFDEPKPPRALDVSIPYELETIVLKALAKSPAERYSSAQELADDLQRFLEDKPIQARRPSLVDRGRKWMRRHPSAVVAALLLLGCGLIGFAVSTAVIAHEQWKTQMAYEQLDAEEKQTKAAFDKLAIEEKRAKDAYAELAEEEARTKAAYEAEARQRHLAEWDFAQAQRAIELVIQFSEGELAHHPDQQDVRRRLLMTVLEYYEEFLEEHEDDPAAKEKLAEGRERVGLILTELSRLRGSTLLAIIKDGKVQEELALEADQIKRIAQFDMNQPRPSPKDKGPKDKGPKDKGPKDKGPKEGPKAPKDQDSAVAVEKLLAEVLNAGQKERFQQIVLQVQQQGRYGFSDPKLVETLKLTAQQRELIRKIQNETQQKWADHLFTDQKIKNLAVFWSAAQDRIDAIMEPEQRSHWREMIGAPIAVELREGYAWDGKNVSVPKPGPFFSFHHPTAAGTIAVLQDHQDFAGSGFGHKVKVDDKQYYSWRGKEIPKTVFEIAVTANSLNEDERRYLVEKHETPPTMKGPGHRGWQVLFRSDDPTIWNTDSPDDKRFAIPIARADKRVRYLRLKRMDTGEILIVPITHSSLLQAPKTMGKQGHVWNGTADEAYGGRHLGIAELRSGRGPWRDGPPRKGPQPGKSPAK